MDFDLLLQLLNQFIHDLTNEKRYDFRAILKKLMPFFIIFMKFLDFMEEKTICSSLNTEKILIDQFGSLNKETNAIFNSNEVLEKVSGFLELFHLKFWSNQ